MRGFEMDEQKKRLQRCCFTGHRPEKLQSDEETVRRALRRSIDVAIKDGFVTFISGMARGVDIWAAEEVLGFRESRPEIHLICAVPFSGFEQGWDLKWRQRYSAVLSCADWVKIVCPAFSMNAFSRRNEWMVNHSKRLVAVYGGRPGGTRNTITYAREQNLEIVILNDARRNPQG